MHEIRNREFHNRIDRGGASVSDSRFVNCQFVNCAFSLTSSPSNISVARNLIFEKCHNCESDVGPSVLENILITDVSTDDLFLLWSPLLRHVTIRGRNGGLKINSSYSCVDVDPAIQRDFAAKRSMFYEETDWALDITEAHFKDVDIEGVPVKLIRRDAHRQFVVSRDRAKEEDWRARVRSKCDFWIWMIDEFLKTGESSKLLVAPEEGSKKELIELTSALLELRDLGVVS